MSKVNHRMNGKKYDKRKSEKAHRYSGEILVDDGTWIPANQVSFLRRAQRRKVRHQHIKDDED